MARNGMRAGKSCYVPTMIAINADGTPRNENPGVEAASKAAASIGASWRSAPPLMGKADFNDSHTRRSLRPSGKRWRRRGAKTPRREVPEGYRGNLLRKNPGLYQRETWEDYEPVWMPCRPHSGTDEKRDLRQLGNALHGLTAGRETAAPPDDVLRVRGTIGRRLWRIRAIPSAGASPTLSPCSFRSRRQPSPDLYCAGGLARFRLRHAR